MKNLFKKLSLILVVFTIFSLSLFASAPGLPTFDFSNLVSAIESISNALKFYDENIEKLNQYKAELEKAARPMTLEDVKDLLDYLRNGKADLTGVIEAIAGLESEMMTKKSEFDDFWNNIDSEVKASLGITSEGGLYNAATSLSASISPELLKNAVNKKLKEAAEVVTKTQEEFDKAKEDYQKQMDALNNHIEKITDEVGDMLLSGRMGQNGMLSLSIKSNEATALKSDKNALEARYDNIKKEITSVLEKNKAEYNTLKDATDRVLNSIKGVEAMNQKTEELQKELSSKKRKKFIF